MDSLVYRAQGHFTGRELYFFDPTGNRLELRDPTWSKGMPEPPLDELSPVADKRTGGLSPACLRPLSVTLPLVRQLHLELGPAGEVAPHVRHCAALQALLSNRSSTSGFSSSYSTCMPPCFWLTSPRAEPANGVCSPAAGAAGAVAKRHVPRPSRARVEVLVVAGVARHHDHRAVLPVRLHHVGHVLLVPEERIARVAAEDEQCARPARAGAPSCTCQPGIRTRGPSWRCRPSRTAR